MLKFKKIFCFLLALCISSFAFACQASKKDSSPTSTQTKNSSIQSNEEPSSVSNTSSISSGSSSSNFSNNNNSSNSSTSSVIDGSNNGSDDTENGEQENETKSIIIANSGNSYFNIVVSAEQDEHVEDAVKSLTDKILNDTGATIEVVTDQSAQSNYEILIGDTARQASINAKSSLSARDWLVKVQEKQIIIVGGSMYSTLLALDAFSEMLILNAKKLSIDEECETSYCYQTDNTETIYGTIDEKRAQFANPYGRPMVSAHRSEHVYSTANSLSGIISAVELGVDIIEIDLQKSSDGYYVLCHDETLTSATNVSDLAGTNGLPTSHYVKDWTLEQIKQLTLKDSPTNEKVVLLNDVFDIIRDKVILLLDKIETEADMLNIYDIAVKERAIDSVMFQFTSSFLPYQKAYSESGIKMLHLYWKNTPELAGTWVESSDYLAREEYSLQAIQVNTPTTTPADTEATAKVRVKCRIFTNTLNFGTGYAQDNEDSWKTHIDSGINIIQTDRPLEVVALSRYYETGVKYTLAYNKSPVLWGATATLTLNLSEDETAYYTMDGSIPDTSDTEYSSALTITQSTILNILVVSGQKSYRLTVNILVYSKEYYDLIGYEKTEEMYLDGIKEDCYGREETVTLNEDRLYTISAFKTDNGVLIFSQGIFNTSVTSEQLWSENTNFEFKLNGGEQSFITANNLSYGVTNFIYKIEYLSGGKYKHTTEIFVHKSLINGWSDTVEVQLNYAWKTPTERAIILSSIADYRYLKDWGNNDVWHSWHTLGCLATGFNDLLANLFISESGLTSKTAPTEHAVIDGRLSASELSKFGDNQLNVDATNVKGRVVDGDLYLAITISHGEWSTYYSGEEWWRNDNFEFYINGTQTVIMFIDGEPIIPHHITHGEAITYFENGEQTTILELYVEGNVDAYEITLNANGDGFGWRDLAWSSQITVNSFGIE